MILKLEEASTIACGGWETTKKNCTKSVNYCLQNKHTYKQIHSRCDSIEYERMLLHLRKWERSSRVWSSSNNNNYVDDNANNICLPIFIKYLVCCVRQLNAAIIGKRSSRYCFHRFWNRNVTCLWSRSLYMCAAATNKNEKDTRSNQFFAIRRQCVHSTRFYGAFLALRCVVFPPLLFVQYFLSPCRHIR